MLCSQIIYLALSTLFLLPTASAYADPGACSGVCTTTHDPSVIRRSSDGAYFRFSTGGKIAIHTAPAFSGPWTYKCAMLPRGSKINLAGRDDLWAPDVSKVGDTYHVYYSTLAAPGLPQARVNRTNAIDAQLLSDGSASRLSFGSFWNGLYQVDMKSPPKSAGTSSKQIAHEPAGEHAIEAPYIIKNGNYYYLFFSTGKCCGYDASRPAAGQEYRIKVCRSSSASSGFVDAKGVSCTSGGGTVVLQSHGNVYGPGGQGVYNDPQDGWVLYYHYVDTIVGYADGQKRFGWNKISWNSGRPVV